eukprot:4816037-Alexandrium_andersonii.AAC.1
MPTFVFDATSAHTHTVEDELVFLQPPREYLEKHPNVLWRAVRVIYGRRKGVRSWQEHFAEIILHKACPVGAHALLVPRGQDPHRPARGRRQRGGPDRAGQEAAGLLGRALGNE